GQPHHDEDEPAGEQDIDRHADRIEEFTGQPRAGGAEQVFRVRTRRQFLTEDAAGQHEADEQERPGYPVATSAAPLLRHDAELREPRSVRWFSVRKAAPRLFRRILSKTSAT